MLSARFLVAALLRSQVRHRRRRPEARTMTAPREVDRNRTVVEQGSSSSWGWFGRSECCDTRTHHGERGPRSSPTSPSTLRPLLGSSGARLVPPEPTTPERRGGPSSHQAGAGATVSPMNRNRPQGCRSVKDAPCQGCRIKDAASRMPQRDAAPSGRKPSWSATHRPLVGPGVDSSARAEGFEPPTF